MLAQDKKMGLCDICSSFLVAKDAIDRSRAHITGKQHIAYGMVRDFISEFKAAREKSKEEGSKENEGRLGRNVRSGEEEEIQAPAEEVIGSMEEPENRGTTATETLSIKGLIFRMNSRGANCK